MRTIKEYHSLSSHTESNKDELVNEFIEEGWVPFGGLSVAFDANYNALCFSQAMVKYNDKS